MDKKAKQVSHKQVCITGGFWQKYLELVRDAVIPYQWEALNDRIPDAEKSYAIENYKIAAGEKEGKFGGRVFQDSDLAKWLEAVSYRLALYPDKDLENTVDNLINLIGRAQQDDGYLNTYFIVKDPEARWTNLKEQHELYCAGHLIEAAVEYFIATGKNNLINIVDKLIDHIGNRFGTGPGQFRGYPGHQEIELALVKLYRVTGNKKYIDLSTYFINERGQKPNYLLHETEINPRKQRTDFWELYGYEYGQSHLPVREQTEAVGHSVRAGYMYAAMADLAYENQDESLVTACKALWENIAEKRSYVNGAVGSEKYGESFTFDYDLPNDTIYGETCAAIALGLFSYRMLFLDMNARYADMLENVLYNSIISGISLDGTRFFYVNPLEVWPQANNHRNDLTHGKVERQKWFGCACCPPNIARTIMSFGRNLYTTDDTTLYVHLYANSETDLTMRDTQVTIRQETDYPWNGEITLGVEPEAPAAFVLAARIPGWCTSAPSLTVNGEALDLTANLSGGYVYIDREWENGDKIQLSLPMETRLVRSHPAVRENIGKACVFRGPILYCIEEEDNGENLHTVYLPPNPSFSAEMQPDLLGGVVTLAADALQLDAGEWTAGLYQTDTPSKLVPCKLRFIPYYVWCNRTPGEMYVWLKERG